MVGLQYFATFLHVAKLPGVAQLSAADCGDLGPGLDIMGTFGWSRPRPRNYKYTELNIRNIANTGNGLLHHPRKWVAIFQLFIFGWVLKRLGEYCVVWPGNGTRVMIHPQHQPPQPRLSFVVFQYRAHEDMSSNIKPVPLSWHPSLFWQNDFR